MEPQAILAMVASNQRHARNRKGAASSSLKEVHGEQDIWDATAAQVPGLVERLNASIAEQRRANDLKELEVQCMMRQIVAKEQELEQKQEMLNVSRTTMKLEREKLFTKEMRWAEDELKSSNSDFFVSGLVVTALSTGLCVLNNLPAWASSLYTECKAKIDGPAAAAAAAAAEAAAAAAEAAASSDEKASTSKSWSWWSSTQKAFFTSWWSLDTIASTVSSSTSTVMSSIKAFLSRYVDYSLCMAEGNMGIICAGGLCIFLVYISTRVLYSSSSGRRTMPMTLFVVLGSVVGLAGGEMVTLMGGNGHDWFCVWMVFCLAHASVHFFARSFLGLFQRCKAAKYFIYAGVGVLLPASMGFVAYPSYTLPAARAAFGLLRRLFLSSGAVGLFVKRESVFKPGI